MLKQILKNLAIILCGCGIFFQKFYAVQPIITIYNPEKLNYINERPYFSLDQNTSSPQVSTASQVASFADEFSDVDLNISTPLLFSDEPVISLYNAPSFSAARIGDLTPPGIVRVVRLFRDFAKVEVCDNQAAWILCRNIETGEFNKKYEERIKNIGTLNTSTEKSSLNMEKTVSIDQKIIVLVPTVSPNVTDNFSEERGLQ